MNNKINLQDHFHVFVITLANWPQRLTKFRERADELGVKGFAYIQGVDGSLIDKPNWWRPNARKWACNLAHLNAVHAGMMANEMAVKKDKPIIILEDDCYLMDNFTETIMDVAEYYKLYEDAGVCFLGGRPHNKGEVVSKGINRPVNVGGGYGYVVSQNYAKVFSGYIMNDPGKVAFIKFNQDTKMQRRWERHNHACCDPLCVGHRGGMSVILKRNRKPERAPKG